MTKTEISDLVKDTVEREVKKALKNDLPDTVEKMLKKQLKTGDANKMVVAVTATALEKFFEIMFTRKSTWKPQLIAAAKA